MSQIVTTSATTAAITVVFAFMLAACQTTAPKGSSERFDKIDANQDGKLTIEEINHSLVSTLFDGHDANKDGQLTEAEWAAPGDAAGVKTFRDNDNNRDGIVTLAEAKTYSRGPGMAAEFVRDADKNHDGVVDRKEARAHYAKTEGSAR